MKINPSSSVLNTTSFFASLTKTTLYFSVDKQSEVNGGGRGLQMSESCIPWKGGG